MTTRDSGSLFLEVAVRPAAFGVGIEVDVYDGASLGTMLATLEGAYEASIQSVMNDTGSGSFKIGRHDPKFNYVAQDNLVKVRVDGVYQFAGFMDNLAEVVASPNGEGAEIDTVGLRGVLAYLERGSVYPSSWPAASDPKVSYVGQTKAAILIDLLTKAQARGALLSMSWDFTATNDSRGFPWVDSNDLDFAMGTDLLTLAKSLSATGDFDIAMSPSFVLHAYVSQGADTSSSVVFREGKHLGQADLGRKLNARTNKTRMLVQGGSAWVDGLGRTQYAVEVNDAGSEATLGRRESFLSYSKSSDPATLTNIGNASIAQLKKQGESLQLPVTHGPALDASGNATGDYEPFVDYVKGDVVALDVPGTFAAAKYRVVGMTLAQRPGGDFDVTLDFNSVYLEYLLRIQQQVNGLTSGTGGGVSSSSVGSTLGGGTSVISGGKVAVASDDSADYLDNKLAQGNGGIVVARIGSGGNQQMQIGANVAPVGTFASRPAASAANASTFYFATDIAGGTLYVSTGSAWDAVAPGVTSGGAFIPASVGTTEGDALYYHAGAWTRLPVGGANAVLHGGADPNYAAVVEADLSLSDVTTGNVSTSKHGLAPKGTGTGTKYLDDVGTYTTPGGAGGGASTADHFIVGQGGDADTDLTNRIVIPRLTGDPDIRAGGANDWEFDSSTLTGWSSFAGGGAVAAFDANTTLKSHLYFEVNSNGGADRWSGLIHAMPAGLSYPVTLTAKIDDMTETGGWPSLFVSDSATAAGQSVTCGPWIGNGLNPPSARASAYTSLPSFAGFGDGGKIFGVYPPFYVRIVLSAANHAMCYMSKRGKVWTLLGTFTNMASAGYWGFATDAFTVVCEQTIDFVRFS